ncbi:MAG: SynChlorMet cassette radical SAM/SPASM protein ScmF [bacterium]|nr:SynChlorMet cassette radical SAM/SPASM protein ScmF [bacterium]
MELETIYFHLAGHCGMNCTHCWLMTPDDNGKHVKQKESFLPFNTFKNVLNQGLDMGVVNVKLTGGEPLIHPEIKNILSFLKSEKIYLIIETNGIPCCDKKIVKKIAECRNSFIAVSLDGVTAEVHEKIRGIKGCFDKTVEGVKNLVNAGLKPQIVMSMTKANKHHIEPMVRFAEKIGADSVKFNIVVPIQKGKTMMKNNELIEISELIEIGDWIENDLAKSSNINIIYSQPFAFRPFSRIMLGGRDESCGIFNIIGVLSSGKYSLCGIGDTVPDLIFGDAENDKLRDIWEKTPLLNDIRKSIPDKLEGICGSCMMKKACLGSCIALNYYRSKNLHSAHWYCEEAYNAGLFPQTRIIGNQQENHG